MRRLLLVLGCLSAACAAPTFDPGERVDAIAGGTAVLDGGYAAVFMIHTDYDTGTKSACTATLITPRTLLTAAHCVDPRKAGATSARIFFQNLPVAPPSDSGVWTEAVEARFHPQYDPSNLFDDDIAAVLLPSAQSVEPVPYNRADVSGLVGAPLTAVGYGITVEGTADYGTRRAVELSFRGVTATHIALGDQVSKGICDGDSGGPSLHQFPDGVTRVVGVHNYKQPGGACHDGLDTRVDLFADFVKQWLVDKEGASCGDDGLCASGCARADPDCPLADGGVPLLKGELPAAGCGVAPGAPLVVLTLAAWRRRRRG